MPPIFLGSVWAVCECDRLTESEPQKLENRNLSWLSDLSGVIGDGLRCLKQNTRCNKEKMENSAKELLAFSDNWGDHMRWWLCNLKVFQKLLWGQQLALFMEM